MDGSRFDALVRTIGEPRSRRGAIATMAGLGVALLSGRVASGQAQCPNGQTPNKKGKCSCPAGTDPCPSGCVDRKRDPSNCGSCGTACPPSAICQRGECVCPAGTEACESGCADLQSDPNNCTECGRACPPSFLCVEGNCVDAACFAAGCGTCGLCVTSVQDGTVCIEGPLSTSCGIACETPDDCPDEGGIRLCVSTESGFRNTDCVPAGEKRCASIAEVCVP